MSPDERARMSPLEIALWAATWVHNGHDMGLEVADQAVERLRRKLAEERAALVIADAKSKHRLRILMKNGTPVGYCCSCGYTPPTGRDRDNDELMALHVTAMRAADESDFDDDGKLVFKEHDADR